MERNTLIAKISEYLECTMDTADLYLMLLEKPYTLDTMMVRDSAEKLEFLSSKCLISEYDDERSGGKRVFLQLILSIHCLQYYLMKLGIETRIYTH